jgi:hypothetical protein
VVAMMLMEQVGGWCDTIQPGSCCVFCLGLTVSFNCKHTDCIGLILCASQLPCVAPGVVEWLICVMC